MAGLSGWYGTAYTCAANPSLSHGVGWYLDGQLISGTYLNPATGKPWTPTELSSAAGGGTVAGDTGGSTVPTTSQLETYNPPTLTEGVGPGGLTYEQYLAQAPKGTSAADVQAHWLAMVNAPQHVGETRVLPSTSTLENLQVPQAPTLPPYKPTAELEKLSSQVGGAISDIITQKGIGMGEETKEQIFLREAEIINANTAQANKNLEDKMAAQGLSDSGMAFSESMKLASKNSIAMANVMRDVEIQDALMKVASYQNALGLGVQFLSYLSEESWRQYQPTLYQWQAQVEMYKMAISQAYTQGNMALAHQYNMELAQFEANTEIQMAEMQLEAANAQAASQGAGSIFGTLLGWLIPGS